MSDLAAFLIAGPITDAHDIHECYGSHIHCHFHGVDEPDGWWQCSECKHWFGYDDSPWRDGDFCPYCLHDY
jgi:hypothetical protein